MVTGVQTDSDVAGIGELPSEDSMGADVTAGDVGASDVPGTTAVVVGTTTG